MIKKPDSWLRFALAMTVFWAILCITDLLLNDVAAFNSGINSTVVRQGYITAMRGIFLALILAAVLSMTALLRRGLVIAPLIWATQIIRVAWMGHWHSMVQNLLFVSDTLNLAVLILLPVLLALLLWRSLDSLDSDINLGFLVPGLWLVLTTVASAGNLFVWHWVLRSGTGAWPSGYGLVLLLAGTIFLAAGAGRRPWAFLTLFFAGLLVPAAVFMVIWGGYDGLGMALLTLLPWGSGDILQTWLELMALTAFPIILVLGVNQFLAWRRGENFVEII